MAFENIAGFCPFSPHSVSDHIKDKAHSNKQTSLQKTVGQVHGRNTRTGQDSNLESPDEKPIP